MLPEITYILLLKAGCCAKSFEFQPSFEWECGFGTQPDLVTSDQNKHLFPHPKINFSTKSLFFKILGRIWVSSNSSWNFTGFMKHVGLEGECILLNFALFMLLLVSVVHLLRDLFSHWWFFFFLQCSSQHGSQHSLLA